MSRALDAARDLRLTLAALADTADRTKPLGHEIVDHLVEAELHALMAPREVGGLEAPLTEALEVYRELSWADGSTGWCAMASATTIAFFGAWASDEAASTIFANGVPLTAGQFAPNGTAKPDGDGYVVNGEYQFGSGIDHAHWVGAGTITVVAPGESPALRFVLMPADAVQPTGNWDVLGLEPTASWDYSVRDVWVPEGATFDFFAPVRHRGGPSFDLGVLALTAVGHAGFALGITRRAIDELVAVARGKLRLGASQVLAEQDRFLVDLATLESRYRAMDAWMTATVAEAEAAAMAGAVTPALLNTLRQATVFVTHQGADIVRTAYLRAGSGALRAGPLNRAFRDIHAGTQHFFASDAATLDMGRDLMQGPQ